MDDSFDQREVANPPMADAPWYFKLGRFMARHKIRGGDRLIAEARRRGYLDRLAVYSLGDVQLRVPLWRPCNAWDRDDVLNYEASFMHGLAVAIAALPDEVTLVDCGADIGTVSAHLVSRCRNISRVVAFEPNMAAYAVLAENLRALPAQATACHAAVGNFCGRGRLVSPPEDPSAHAMFIERDPQGSIAVQRVDDLDLAPGKPCVIKIDVEGSECAVVEGALRTIREASAAVITFEAHPRVTHRTGEDPVSVMRALRAVRPDFTFDAAKTGVQASEPLCRLAPDVPLFEQLPPERVYNVIACSRGR